MQYSDNYCDISGNLWQFKRHERPIDNNGAFITITAENSSSFKYKSNFIGDADVDGVNRKKEGVKIVEPLKYLSNCWRLSEMSLINCKVDLSLEWYENFILSSARIASIFVITDTKLYVPVLL